MGAVKGIAVCELLADMCDVCRSVVDKLDLDKARVLVDEVDAWKLVAWSIDVCALVVERVENALLSVFSVITVVKMSGGKV